MLEKEPSSESLLVIREMRAQDIGRLIKLRQEIDSNTEYMPTNPGERRESFLYNFLRYYWHKRRLHTYLAFEGGELVGYTTVVIGKFSKFRGNAYIANVSVKDSSRGHGIGKKLMKMAEEYASALKARRIELEVFANNEPAKKLYEKLGYEVEGRKRKAIKTKDGYEDLIFMAKFI